MGAVDLPAMLMSEHSFGIDYNNADNAMKMRELSFFVLGYCKDKTDDAAYDAAFDTAEADCDHIVNRLRNDARAPWTAGRLRSFTFRDVQAVEVENEAIGAYGYFVTVVLAQTYNQKT
jgi:hypothetical protein